MAELLKVSKGQSGSWALSECNRDDDWVKNMSFYLVPQLDYGKIWDTYFLVYKLLKTDKGIIIDHQTSEVGACDVTPRNVVEQPESSLSSNVKLIITVMSAKDSNINTSPEITIKNLAIIRFQFRVIKQEGRYNQPIACSVSSRKHSSVFKDEIKISLTCKEQDYSEEWMCTEHWSTWNEIGNQGLKEMERDYPDVYLHIFEFVINVRAMVPNMFAKLYEDKDFTDFRISSSEGSMAVHKACLASHSDMFKTLLANEWKELAECRIEPEGVTMQTLQHLKDYLYLGSLQDCSLRKLLLIAKRYRMKNLQAECIFGLARKVTSADLFDLLEFARENEIRGLTLAVIELTPMKVVESISQSLSHYV